MIGRFVEMSLSEGQDELLFLGGDREISKGRWVPNDIGNIIHCKLNVKGCQLVILSSERENIHAITYYQSFIRARLGYKGANRPPSSYLTSYHCSLPHFQAQRIIRHLTIFSRSAR